MNETLNKKLKENKMIIGTHIFAGMPILTEAIAQCGFDVLWIDMEHTSIGTDTLVNNLIAAKAGGTPSWVRIPWNDPVLAKPVLDMGVDGIIFPYIRTTEDAKLAVESCFYPPKGIRGYGPLRALNYGGITQMEYVTDTFKQCKRIIQIEHIDAVKNLRKIAEIDGIDAFIVGPNDLSGSVGLIGQIHHPDVTPLYKEIADVLREAGKPFGVATGFDPVFMKEWAELGATIFFAGSDVSYVHDGATAMRKNYNFLT